MMKPTDNCIRVKAGTQVNPKFVPVGSGATGASAATFTAQAQEDVFLKYLYLSVGAGVVNDLKIGNQSLNCSDSDISTALFDPTTQRKPAIGVAVNGNIQMSVEVTTDADGKFSGAFSCEAIEKAPTMAEQGDAINKFFGLGKVSVPAGGAAQLSAQALRNTTLKDLVLLCHTAASSADIEVTDISIKGRSIFSGQSSDSVSLDALQTAVQGFAVGINTPIETNERVIVSLKNNNAAAITVSGGLYCV
jgi:hypothetical protein